jgi:hypothetical protein
MLVNGLFWIAVVVVGLAIWTSNLPIYRRDAHGPVCTGEGRVPSRSPILKSANIAVYPAKGETLPERTAIHGSSVCWANAPGFSRIAERTGS